MHTTEISRFFSETFSLIVPENIVEGPFCFAEKVWYRQIFCIRGRCQVFFVATSLSHSTGKLPCGTLLSFRKTSVWKMLKDRMEITRSSVRVILSHSTANIQRGSLLVSQKFRFRKKNSCIRGDHVLLSELICVTVPKQFVEGPICKSEKFRYRKIYAQGGDITFFCRRYFVSYYRKTS